MPRRSFHCLPLPSTVHRAAAPQCPDGYTGSYSAYKCARHCNPEDNYRIPRDGGYDDWEYFDGNPFSNKIILMDEARRRALSTVTEWLGEVEPKTE